MMLLQNQHKGNYTGPGAPFTYFTDGEEGGEGGGVRGIILGLKFWPKGIFLGLWKTRGIFGVLHFSSAQINNNISVFYC